MKEALSSLASILRHNQQFIIIKCAHWHMICH